MAIFATLTPATHRSPRRRARALVAAGIALGAGISFGVGCGQADTVGIGTDVCTPTFCQADDTPPGPPDGPSLCPAGKCNYQTQTGCPAAATCFALPDPTKGTVSPACLVTGNVPAGAACDDTNICQKGLQCIHTAGKPGVCRKLCCSEPGAQYGDWRACPKGESCIRQIEVQFKNMSGPQSDAGTNFTTIDAHVMACVPVNECDVLDATSCQANTDRPVCRIVDPLANVACRPPGNATLGETCDQLHQCGPVQICAHTTDKHGVDLSGPLSCRRLCRVGDCTTNACPPAEGTCVHFHRDPAGVGECTPLFDTKTGCHPIDGGVPVPVPTATQDASKEGG